ncbi:pentatricopeptide repeat-containing protein At1g07590, mitochondrial isoform X2 [Elaeis guineensis]|uniref:Pentatricopeptide repeat-containing protein At1g07590, mitochondrial isoform X2 n=1 Tax=Elaeis guineensis var. tenera TaxID=51953 RepID=A0A6J0PAZ5_ELAGV|nr:pentatricopeptide repeat-containing protein At1g07590, mitochondrial isoform X2 [Elaeis guineensis]
MPRFRLPLFLCRRSRDLHLHSILRSFASCPLPVASPLDFPKPQEREGEPSEEKPGETLSSRVERLTRGESVVSAFQRWMRQGFAIHRGDIFHAINRLRKLKMNKRALEVMEWVIRERPYKLKELEYSYLLEFTTKIHGISHGRKKSIPRILTQMKADGVSPHTSTYNILLKMEADDHNIEGLSKVFIEMQRAKVEPDEITFGILAIAHAVARLYTVSETYVEAIERSKTGNNWSTLDILLILYGYLGKKEKLERTWKFVEELPHARSKSFMLAIEAFGRIGHVSRAEEIWAEMKSNRELKLTKQFNSIISVYCRHGLMEKASEMFKQMEANGCEPNAITYRHLALGCLKVGLIKEALKTMNMGRSETMGFQVRRSTPWLETTHMVLEAFADLGDLENTKMLFKEFKETKYCRYTFVYNTLLKAYVKAKVYDPELLRKMILGGARPDAETYSLVRLLEQFKN